MSKRHQVFIILGLVVLACVLSTVRSHKAECEKRGGVLVRAATGGFECIAAERR